MILPPSQPVLPLSDPTPFSQDQISPQIDQNQSISDLPIDTPADQKSTTQASAGILPPSQPVLPLPDPTPFSQDQISPQIDQYENPAATSAPPSPCTNLSAKRLPSLRSAGDYPFIEPERLADHDGKLTELGWTVIDVPGDGNCGYFCFVLGLESLNMKQYNPAHDGSLQRIDGVTPQTFRKKAWDRQTIRLRKDLFDHARHLRTNVYKNGQEPEWWWNVSPLEEKEIEDSFTSFYTEGATERFYFKGKNRKLASQHHMMAFWGPFVLASLHNIRVIIVMRQKYEDNLGNEKDDWDTWIYSNGDNIPPTQQPGIYRMPDDEFTRIPSIEIFYTGGTGLDNHFQYLTRTSYDDETTPTCPPTRNATLPPDSHMEINNASLPVEEILLHPETVIPSQITEVESPAPDSVPRSQSTLSQISTVMENKKLSAVVKKMYLAKNVNIRSLFPTKPPNRKETEETNKATDDDDIQSVTPPRHNNLVVRSSCLLYTSRRG